MIYSEVKTKFCPHAFDKIREHFLIQIRSNVFNEVISLNFSEVKIGIHKVYSSTCTLND